MKRFKSRSGYVFAIILTTLFVTACGLFGEEAPPTVPPEPITLRYVTFGVLAAAEDALIKQFEADHPNLKIDSEEFRQSPLQYLTDTTPPDVITIAPSRWLDQAIEQNLVTDISDLWQQAGFVDAYPANLRALSERDGKQYFLPIGYNWNGIYYNKEVFAQYNLQPPRTWDEFMALCDTLLVNGVTPLSLSGSDPFMAALWIDYLDLRLNGADFHRQLGNGEIPYDDARVRAVFELWRSLFNQGYFLEDARNMSSLTSLMATIRGDKGEVVSNKAAMVLSGSLYMDDLPEPFRPELDFFPFPSIDPTLPSSEVVFSIGYMIPANAPHRSEALTFLTYLGSEQAQAILYQNANSGLYAPARIMDGAGELPATVQQGIQLVQNSEKVGIPYFLSIDDRQQFGLDDILRRIVSDPQASKPFDLDELLSKLEEARLAQ